MLGKSLGAISKQLFIQRLSVEMYASAGYSDMSSLCQNLNEDTNFQMKENWL